LTSRDKEDISRKSGNHHAASDSENLHIADGRALKALYFSDLAFLFLTTLMCDTYKVVPSFDNDPKDLVEKKPGEN
jgi:hypothetical protein